MANVKSPGTTQRSRGNPTKKHNRASYGFDVVRTIATRVPRSKLKEISSPTKKQRRDAFALKVIAGNGDYKKTAEECSWRYQKPTK